MEHCVFRLRASSKEATWFKQRAEPWLSEHTVRALKWKQGRGTKNKTLGLESGIREGTNKGQTVTGGWERLWADAGFGLWMESSRSHLILWKSISESRLFCWPLWGRLGNCTAFLLTLQQSPPPDLCMLGPRS